MRSTGLFVILLLFFGLAGPASGASGERIPAGFGSGDRALDKLIKFPEGSADVDKTLICQGILKITGKLDQRACYLVEPRDAEYVSAIDKAGKKALFTPARYDGKKISIYFQFRVRFIRKDDEERIVLYANQAYPENLAAYGEDHVAAQRAVTREKWEKACPHQARFIVLARVHVSADGTQGSINVTHGSGIPVSDSCKQAVVETLEQSRFIPAFADGEAVPSSYLEAFGN